MRWAHLGGAASRRAVLHRDSSGAFPFRPRLRALQPFIKVFRQDWQEFGGTCLSHPSTPDPYARQICREGAWPGKRGQTPRNPYFSPFAGSVPEIQAFCGVRPRLLHLRSKILIANPSSFTASAPQHIQPPTRRRASAGCRNNSSMHDRASGRTASTELRRWNHSAASRDR